MYVCIHFKIKFLAEFIDNSHDSVKEAVPGRTYKMESTLVAERFQHGHTPSIAYDVLESKRLLLNYL